MSAPTANPIDLIARSAIDILQQLLDFVDPLSPAVYTQPSNRIPGSTMGKHVRHVLDHFGKLLTPHTPSGDRQVVYYDRRQRQGPLESDPQEVMKTIRQIQDLVSQVHVDSWLTVCVMVTAEGTEAQVQSTMARELWFAVHHAIHHHAMLKVMADEMGVTAPSGFGLAPSTSQHRIQESDKQCKKS